MVPRADDVSMFNLMLGFSISNVSLSITLSLQCGHLIFNEMAFVMGDEF
jgi:hypothetical protein